MKNIIKKSLSQHFRLLLQFIQQLGKAFGIFNPSRKNSPKFEVTISEKFVTSNVSGSSITYPTNALAWLRPIEKIATSKMLKSNEAANFSID